MKQLLQRFHGKIFKNISHARLFKKGKRQSVTTQFLLENRFSGCQGNFCKPKTKGLCQFRPGSRCLAALLHFLGKTNRSILTKNFYNITILQNIVRAYLTITDKCPHAAVANGRMYTKSKIKGYGTYRQTDKISLGRIGINFLAAASRNHVPVRNRVIAAEDIKHFLDLANKFSLLFSTACPVPNQTALGLSCHFFGTDLEKLFYAADVGTGM